MIFDSRCAHDKIDLNPIIKPAGRNCNAACRYCFYRTEAGADARMTDEILQRKETRLRIGSALASLSEAHRSVLRLKYDEGRSVQEIAQTLGRSEKAVESLLTRAREAFRDQFLALLDEEGKIK